MADVSIRGVTYTGVAKLDLDKSGGGSAIYYDTEDADAVAADILTGKKAYGTSGLITGTRQPPRGSISITDNGSVDVTDYATALVNVQGGGGGPTASDAILTVTAPAGSTITATKGSATLVPTLWTTADGNQECALFVIEPEQFDSSTPWTVTATLGTDTATDTVTIDSNKRYDVELSYNLYIIKNGVEQTGFTITYASMPVHTLEDGILLLQTGTSSGRMVVGPLPSANDRTKAVFEFEKIESIGSNVSRAAIGAGTGTTRAAETYLTNSAVPITVNVDISTLSVYGLYAKLLIDGGTAYVTKKAWLKNIYLAR